MSSTVNDILKLLGFAGKQNADKENALSNSSTMEKAEVITNRTNDVTTIPDFIFVLAKERTSNAVPYEVALAMTIKDYIASQSLLDQNSASTNTHHHSPLKK